MKKIHYSEMPGDWAVCWVNNCPQADECLRHESHIQFPSELKEHVCVLPQACTQDGHCPMFVTNAPSTLAWGMRGLLNRVRIADQPRIRRELIALFGDRRRYYRFREGRWVISPQMQTAIALILRRNGYAAEPQFDRTTCETYFPNATDYIFPHEAGICDTSVTT